MLEEERTNVRHDGATDEPVTPFRSDEPAAGPRPAEEVARQDSNSLIDDLTALYEDGKTYVEAEAQYQRTRAQFVSNRAGKAAGLGLGALGAVHLALIAFAVGMVITLATLVGPLAATLIVTIAFLVLGGVLAMMARNKAREAKSAFGGDKR